MSRNTDRAREGTHKRGGKHARRLEERSPTPHDPAQHPTPRPDTTDDHNDQLRPMRQKRHDEAGDSSSDEERGSALHDRRAPANGGSPAVSRRRAQTVATPSPPHATRHDKKAAVRSHNEGGRSAGRTTAHTTRTQTTTLTTASGRIGGHQAELPGGGAHSCGGRSPARRGYARGIHNPSHAQDNHDDCNTLDDTPCTPTRLRTRDPQEHREGQHNDTTKHTIYTTDSTPPHHRTHDADRKADDP